MGNIGGGEMLLLILLALVILGPDKLPGYAAKLAHGVRRAKDLAEGAKSQLQEEMGPAFDDVNWRQLDPRQYDPRRIVRDALSSPEQPASASTQQGPGSETAALEPAGRAPGRAPGPRRSVFDPSLPTPYDVDAT